MTSVGHGIHGYANNPTAPNNGVYGVSSSSAGKGVHGYAAATSGTTHGVYGQSNSPNGYGVYGKNNSGGTGIYGNGGTRGVYGRSFSTSGRGVYGYASATSGETYGVYGQSDSNNNGIGVYGNGNMAGVYGEGGTGVHGKGGWVRHGPAPVAYAAPGVYGEATYASGVYGKGKVGVKGYGTDYGVSGSCDSPNCYAAIFRNYSGGVALSANTYSGNGNIIEAWSGSDQQDRKFRVETSGNVRADGSFIGGGADYAEALPGVAGLEPGDVLVIGPDGHLARSTQAYQSSVAGVYSTEPGFIAGGGDESDDLTAKKVPLAMMGVVPVKASAEHGPILPGDLLTASSTPGHAMHAGENPQVGTIIGKAFEPLAEGTGIIKMLVILQ